MNLPNKLTVLRVIMIPFFVAALMAEGGDKSGVPVCGRRDLYHCQPDGYAGRENREKI